MPDEDMHEHADITERPEELSPPANVEALKLELGEARAKAREYLEGWQRAQADFTNYKRRLEQDKAEAVKFANSELILKILPVLDDFERAISHVPPGMENEPWVGGINGIARKLENVLTGAGLSRIEAQGEFFDPTLHEATGCVPGPEDVVMQELQKGYKLNDRVLRCSRVLVGTGENGEGEVGVEE